MIYNMTDSLFSMPCERNCIYAVVVRGGCGGEGGCGIEGGCIVNEICRCMVSTGHSSIKMQAFYTIIHTIHRKYQSQGAIIRIDQSQGAIIRIDQSQGAIIRMDC